MVPGGGKAPLPQGGADFLHPFPGGAVDDAALAPALLEQGEELGELALGPQDLEGQVGPVEAGDGHKGVFQVQQGEDVLPDLGGGGGGKGGDHRPAGELSQKLRDGQVAGAEVLAPLGDAVGLVHGDHGDGGVLGEVQKLRGEQALGSHVDDLVHPVSGVAQGGPVLAVGQGAVEVRPPDAVLHQGPHLVLHQGDEGGHHQGQAGKEQGGDLVAQGLPRPGGHNPHRVPAAEQGVHQLLLPRAEGGVAEHLPQDLQFLFHSRPSFPHKLPPV